MSWSECLRILRAKWLVVLGCAIAGFALSVAASRAVTPTYNASTSVYFSPNSVESGNDLAQGATFTRDQMESYATLATQPVVLEPVIEELDLRTTPRALAHRISATSPKNTVVLRIDVTDTDPSVAAQIANATAKHLGTASSDLAPTTKGQPTIKATPVAVATPPSVPSSPNTRRNAAAGLLAGLFLGVLIALGRGVVDSRVRSAADLAKTTTAQLLGQIPLGRSRAGQARIAFARPETAGADAYRRLRTNLVATAPDEEPRTLVVTSAQEGEGKTVTAINLAVVAAEAGARVLLIDANLRGPRVADYIGLSDNPGLSAALADRADIADLVQPLIPDALDVLTSGPVPSRPSALIGSPEMNSLLQEVQGRYDLVLLDTSAISTSADPLLLAPEASGAIVVSSARLTRRARVQDALAELDRVDATVAGIVLNEVRQRRTGGRRWERQSRDGKSASPEYEFQPLLRTRTGRDRTNEPEPPAEPRASAGQKRDSTRSSDSVARAR